LFEELKELRTEQKLVNFVFRKFKADKQDRGKKLNITDDDDLTFLRLQSEVGLDVIQLVNSNNIRTQSPLQGRINNARDWMADSDYENRLMVIARMNSEADLRILRDKVQVDEESIDCIGLQMTYQSNIRTFCFMIMDYLKPLNKWIHAFNFPDTVRDLGWAGTPGPHISVCGINTYNGPDASPETSQYYRRYLEGVKKESGTEAFMEIVKEAKILLDSDYGYYKVRYLLDHPEIRISHYYDVRDLVANPEKAIDNITSHNFNVHYSEAEIIRSLKSDYDWMEDISEKSYPSEFFRGIMPAILD
jgi:hypothetical protein